MYTTLYEQAHYEDKNESRLKKTRQNIWKWFRHKLEAMNMNDKNQLVHLQGEYSYNYTVIYNFINTKKNIVNVIQYLKVNSIYTKEATKLIQSTSGDTIRVELGQSDSTYNIVVNFSFFLYRVELNIHMK